MSYSRSKKLTDTEKRLHRLRTQLYGKEPIKTPATVRTPSTFTFKSVTTPVSQPSIGASCLRRDLIKIAVLASSAVAIELLLFLGASQGILKF